MTSETVDAAATAATTITSSNTSEQTEVFNESKQSHHSMEMYIMIWWCIIAGIDMKQWYPIFDLPHSKLNQRKANDNPVVML